MTPPWAFEVVFPSGQKKEKLGIEQFDLLLQNDLIDPLSFKIVQNNL